MFEGWVKVIGATTTDPEFLSQLRELLGLRISRESPALIGIAGPPGAGKSTFGAALAQSLAVEPGSHGVCVSLDDFYLTPPECHARGYCFRGPPGTHDVELLRSFLHQVASGHSLDVPRYDRGLEQRLPHEHVTRAARPCVMEGWFVGARLPDYEELANSVDCLIYLDMALDDARVSRFERERRLRESGQPAMSEAEVIGYWDEVLAPGIEQWLLPIRGHSDLLIEVDRHHRITQFAVTACR